MSDTAEKKEMTLEQGFERLEKITMQMETGDLPLEEMYVLYKEGLSIVKECSQKIDTVEKNIQLLDADGNLNNFE